MGILDKNISRRDFLRGSAAATAIVASAGLVGYTPNEPVSNAGSNEEPLHRVHALDKDILNGKGEWHPVRCYQNCNGHCSNFVYVVDGVVTRQKTDDFSPDTSEHPQQRGCIRGRSMRQQVYNVDRIKYPMKRKHWQPGGGENTHGELRGKDEWERISWDEALDYVAGELRRVYDTYGPRAVICNGWRWTPGAKLLKAAGGCIFNADVESYGTWGFKPNALGLSCIGDMPDLRMANDRLDMQNAEYIVFYGCNPNWAQAAIPNYYFKLAQEAGAKFVYVGPSRNVTAATYDAKWIRVRVGTDTAFLLAVMYEMIRLDEAEGGIIDWEFLDKYTVGFDLDHMPKDAKLNECIKGYVLGEYDNIPKTPEWAAEICGTPVEDITWYARVCGKSNKTMLLHSYAASRANGAENLPQAYLTVGAMGGHMGKSGHACASIFTWDCGDSGPRLVDTTGYRDVNFDNPIAPNDMIEGPSWWKSLLDGKYISTCKTAHCDSGNVEFHKAIELDVNPRIMFAPQSNFMQTRQNLNDGIKAMRQADMCVSLEIKSSLNAMFADIILPVITGWECNDDPNDGPLVWPSVFGDGNGLAQRKDAVVAWWPVIKPIYETRSDMWALREIAARMGHNPDEVYPYSDKLQYFDFFLNMQYLDEDGKTWKTCFTFTEEDAKKFGVDNKPQQGTMDFNEFLRCGTFVVKRRPGDNLGYIGYKDFVDDPAANPRPSVSGKLELYCQDKADHINIMGLNPEPIKPYANYIVPIAGYEESFSDWENKVKGEYPLQLYNPHYLRRAHSCYDNMAWLQEAFQNPVFMNADDASERGIDNGDTVLIRSAYGKCLRHAQLLESMMPGSVGLPHGAHSVLDETNPNDIIDRGGNENILYGPIHSNYYHHLDGYNTVLVEIEKYHGDPIPKDYERDPFVLL